MDKEIKIDTNAESVTLNIPSEEMRMTCGTCYMCGKEMADVMQSFEGIPMAYHSECAKCPTCGSDFVMWQMTRRPLIFRCLNCLVRWQIG